MNEASVPEALELKKETAEDKFIAIYIAILAVLLAVNAVGGGNAAKTVNTTGIEINDTWSFYQAKNIRQTMFRLFADTYDVFGGDPKFADETRKTFHDKAATYRATAERYENEPGDGKKALEAKAKKYTAEREVALTQDPYFDYSGAMLQIAIVLASVSLLLRNRMLLRGSFGLGAVGTLLLINAFFLLVKIPFLG